MSASKVEDFFQDAKEAYLDGNYKVAEHLLQQMILQNSKNPEVYQMLATICYDKGQFNRAIKTFKRALEIDPTYTDASLGLSIILNDLGRYEEGKKVFDDARELLDRKNKKTDSYLEEKIAAKHEELADLYYQCHQFQEAIEQLQKAQLKTHRKIDIALRIADCYTKLGQTDKVINDLRKLIKDYPQIVSLRMKLAQVYYDAQNIAEAVEQFENILTIDPSHSEARRLLKMSQTAGITSLSTGW